MYPKLLESDNCCSSYRRRLGGVLFCNTVLFDASVAIATYTGIMQFNSGRLFRIQKEFLDAFVVTEAAVANCLATLRQTDRMTGIHLFALCWTSKRQLFASDACI